MLSHPHPGRWVPCPAGTFAHLRGLFGRASLRAAASPCRKCKRFPSCPGSGVCTTCTLHFSLFAYHAVSVRVVHVLVSGVPPVDRRNSVGTRLSEGDPAVSIIVPQGKDVHAKGPGWGSTEKLASEYRLRLLRLRLPARPSPLNRTRPELYLSRLS